MDDFKFYIGDIEITSPDGWAAPAYQPNSIIIVAHDRPVKASEFEEAEVLND